MIAAARADFQHTLYAVQLQELRHEGNNVGLGNRLAVADGQRHVGVGQRLLVCGNELMTRQAFHHREHRRRKFQQLLPHHAFPRGG